MMSRVRISCAGLAKLHRKAIATASMPCPAKRSSVASTSSSRNPTTTSPAKSTRSVISNTWRRGTTGSGRLLIDQSSCSSMDAPSARPMSFMMRMASGWPRVVSSATRAIRPVTSALVPAVVPCASLAAAASTRSASRPSPAAAASMEPKKPSARSAGVVGTLPVVISPPASMIAQSVNVPPMSTPTKQPSSRRMRRILAERAGGCLSARGGGGRGRRRGRGLQTAPPRVRWRLHTAS